MKAYLAPLPDRFFVFQRIHIIYSRAHIISTEVRYLHRVLPWSKGYYSSLGEQGTLRDRDSVGQPLHPLR